MAWTEDGVLINSGRFDGLGVTDAKAQITEWLEEEGIGQQEINYRARLVVFSSAILGEPFPIVYTEDGVPHPVSTEELPIRCRILKRIVRLRTVSHHWLEQKSGAKQNGMVNLHCAKRIRCLNGLVRVGIIFGIWMQETQKHHFRKMQFNTGKT